MKSGLLLAVKKFLENPEIRVIYTPSEEVVHLRERVEQLERENTDLKRKYDLLERQYAIKSDLALRLNDEIFDLKRSVKQ